MSRQHPEAPQKVGPGVRNIGDPNARGAGQIDRQGRPGHQQCRDLCRHHFSSTSPRGRTFRKTSQELRKKSTRVRDDLLGGCPARYLVEQNDRAHVADRYPVARNQKPPRGAKTSQQSTAASDPRRTKVISTSPVILNQSMDSYRKCRHERHFSRPTCFR